MGEVLFYHLTTRPLEQAAPAILEKCVERAWKVTIRCGSPVRVAALDRHLWTYRDEGFLPHGVAGADNADRQPIYITAGEEKPNVPEILFLVDGATSTVDEMSTHMRTLLMFDGHDEDAVADARKIWKSVAESSLKAIYWAQNDEGGWAKRAESG